MRRHLIVATVIVLVLGAGIAIAQVGDDGVIYACADEKTGELRLVDGPDDCGKKEVSVSWNQQGVPGLDGADGEDGLDGQPGADGNLALADQVCFEDGASVIGFDAAGDIICQVGGATTTTTTTPPGWEPTLFAVAYTDMNPADGGYNADVDVLIAKLIDGPNNDGVPGPGDFVTTHQFPIDLSASEFVDLHITEHPIDTAFGRWGGGIGARTPTGTLYEFEHYPGWYDRFSEEQNPVRRAWFDDYLAGSEPDTLHVDAATPSQPGDPDFGPSFSGVHESALSLQDDTFVDVDIYYTFGSTVGPVYPWLLEWEEFTVNAGDTVLLGARWGACTPELAQQANGVVTYDYTIDGVPIDTEIEFDAPAASSWDFPEGASCIITSPENPPGEDLVWLIYGQHPVVFDTPGDYEIGVTVTATEPITDGADFDLDGLPDWYSGVIWDEASIVHVVAP